MVCKPQIDNHWFKVIVNGKTQKCGLNVQSRLVYTGRLHKLLYMILANTENTVKDFMGFIDFPKPMRVSIRKKYRKR